MLLKLIKYEFKATGFRFLQLFGIALLSSVLTAVLIPFSIKNDNEYRVVSAIISFVIGMWVLVLIALSIFTLILIVHRFYHSMVGKGAYFTYCIPASAEQLVGSKLIVALVWYVLSFLVLAAGILIVSVSAMATMGAFDADVFGRFNVAYMEMQSSIEGMQLIDIINSLIGTYVVSAAISTVYGIIVWYFAAAVGMQALKHKAGFMILTVVGISMLMQVISSIVMSGDVFRIAMSDSFQYFNNMGGIEPFKEFVDIQKLWIIKVTVISVVLSIAGFFGTIQLVKKRPNVN